MNRRTQIACAWCGPGMTLFFFVGLLVLAKFIPPPNPDASADEVARMFQVDTTRIRAGVLISMVGTGLLCPFFAAVAIQLKRIEGRWSPLTYAFMMAAACSCLEIAAPMMTWEAAAYRPYRSPEVTQAMNDLAWLPFLGLTTTVLVQNAIIGITILRDRRPEPIFPRWAAYLNFWIGVGIFPAGLIVFFKTGPLAWNGILAWWLPIVSFFIWIITMAILVTRAVRRQYDDVGAAGDDEPYVSHREPLAVPQPAGG